MVVVGLGGGPRQPGGHCGGPGATEGSLWEQLHQEVPGPPRALPPGYRDLWWRPSPAQQDSSPARAVWWSRKGPSSSLYIQILIDKLDRCNLSVCTLCRVIVYSKIRLPKVYWDPCFSFTERIGELFLEVITVGWFFVLRSLLTTMYFLQVLSTLTIIRIGIQNKSFRIHNTGCHNEASSLTDHLCFYLKLLLLDYL